NSEAVRVDDEYFAKVGPQGIYEFYHAHNHHFLAWSAMFEGNYATALKAARDVVADLPAAFLPDPSIAEFLPMVFHVFIRFGRCDHPPADPPARPALPNDELRWIKCSCVTLRHALRIDEENDDNIHIAKAAAAVPATYLVYLSYTMEDEVVDREIVTIRIEFL